MIDCLVDFFITLNGRIIEQGKRHFIVEIG